MFTGRLHVKSVNQAPLAPVLRVLAGWRGMERGHQVAIRTPDAHRGLRGLKPGLGNEETVSGGRDVVRPSRKHAEKMWSEREEGACHSARSAEGERRVRAGAEAGDASRVRPREAFKTRLHLSRGRGNPRTAQSRSRVLGYAG